jgi:hypothetical protein
VTGRFDQLARTTPTNVDYDVNYDVNADFKQRDAGSSP